MCGRAYETYSEEEITARYLTGVIRRSPLKDFRPNYNLAPTQLSPIVYFQEDGRRIELFRWGLVPFWAKDVKSADKYSLINAKGEEIDTKRSYKTAFERRRCIVPLSGFFEWKRKDGKKCPFAIRLKDDPMMSVAGVYEIWSSKETGEEVSSFSIITTAANDFMAKIHDRMPVILDRKQEDTWLDPDNRDVASLKKLLKPCASQLLEAYEVSTLVNSVRNNTPDVLGSVELRTRPKAALKL